MKVICSPEKHASENGWARHVTCAPFSGGGGSLAVQLCLTLVTPWTVACHTPWSMGFPRQEYWSGLPFPSPDPSLRNPEFTGLHYPDCQDPVSVPASLRSVPKTPCHTWHVPFTLFLVTDMCMECLAYNDSVQTPSLLQNHGLFSGPSSPTHHIPMQTILSSPGKTGSSSPLLPFSKMVLIFDTLKGGGKAAVSFPLYSLVLILFSVTSL